MNAIRLYTGPLSMFGAKAEIALLEKGLDFERIAVPFVDRYEPKHPEVVRINPKQQVPVLIHGSVEIFDSTQIFEYLEDAFSIPPLWPKSPADRAEARQLELKSDEVYFPHIIKLMSLEETPADPAAVAARSAAARFYEQMNARLESRSFLAGEYSYADIAFFMAQLFGERKGAIMTGDNPATARLARADARAAGGQASRWRDGGLDCIAGPAGARVPDARTSVSRLTADAIAT